MGAKQPGAKFPHCPSGRQSTAPTVQQDRKQRKLSNTPNLEHLDFCLQHSLDNPKPKTELFWSLPCYGLQCYQESVKSGNGIDDA